jgi:tripartite-type tricarboxylate transporter receptor subunit TctC
MLKTIAFLENKGLKKIKKDYHEKVWNYDFVEFLRKEKIFTTLMTPQGYGAEGSRWKNFGELMAYMKQNPGKVRGSSTGVGSVGFFNFEVIRMETGNGINMIPFKGASPALTALLGGHVGTSALTLGLISPHVKAGKLRVLLTSQKVPEFPDIPTLKQLGYKRNIMSIRFSFYLPAGVPDSVKKVLVPAVEKAVKTPEVVNAIQQIGTIEDFLPGEEFKKMMTDEYEMVWKLMKTSAVGGK